MLDNVPESTVIVVGGGASGLSAAAALSRRGIDAVVLEHDRELGGTWARRYDRLHLHTVRQFSGLAYFPIPRSYPAYLSRDEVVEYLREYARHFGLDDCGEPRGASGEPTSHPGLYFIGFTHSLRGHLFEANRASRRLAGHVERYLRSHVRP